MFFHSGFFLKLLNTYFSKHKHKLPFLMLLASGVGVRLLLISQSWPHVNFDEGTIGEMALNIAFHGEHPVYFYGQNYMGVLQAYIAAGFFRLSGVSLFSLRLGLVLFIAVFLMCMYVLTNMIYTRKLALLTLLLLGLGANFVLYRELQAIGGYPDTLMFGSLAPVLATWLARSSHGEQRRISRLLAYCGYGLVVGLGLWTDLLILPCVVGSGLLLLLFCWRDIRSFAPFCLFFFLVLGISPAIWHNLHTGSGSPGKDTIGTIVAIFHGGSHSLLGTLLHSMFSATVIGLPTFTGYSICPLTNTLFFGGSGREALGCVMIQGIWGLGAITLWLCSLCITAKALYTRWSHCQGDTEERRQSIIRSCARLAVLGTAALSFAAFAISPTAISSPYLNSRYLICILIGTPALIHPLWRTARMIWRWRGWRKSVSVGSWIALISIMAVFLLSMIQTVQDIPNATFANNQQYDLVYNLMRIRAIHIYSDFFDCDRIIFLSQEKIACNVMDNLMHPTGSRYPVLGEIVARDPLASYVFPRGSAQMRICTERFGYNRLYRSFSFDGYMIYQPEPHGI